MKAKISALMDGELQDAEFAEMMKALREDGPALETWRRYHLISDAMRDTQLLSSGFSSRFAARLAEEPTVLAPARAAPQSRRWVPLSMAASLAAVALVGWLAFAPQGRMDRGAAPIAQAPAGAAPAAAEIAAVPPPRAADDYLIAHQSYSPRNSLQGVTPYVRTVADSARTR